MKHNNIWNRFPCHAASQTLATKPTQHPNLDLSLSPWSAHKTLATVHYQWAILDLPQHVHPFHFPRHPWFRPHCHWLYQARGGALLQPAWKSSFGLYEPGPGSLLHPGGFGPEEVVPRVGLTCFVKQCAGFDALPICLFESAGEGYLGQDLIPAANEMRAAVLLNCCWWIWPWTM